MDTVLDRESEILHALNVFVRPNQLTALWAYHDPNVTDHARIYRDLKMMAKAAVELSDSIKSEGIYFTLNPIKDELLAIGRRSGYTPITNESIASRQWLPIDIDAHRLDEADQRLTGETAKCSSTDAERTSAWNMLCSCRELCDGAGCTGAVVGDSGNGWHLCYPVDMLNDEASYATVAGVLAGLQTKCATDGAEVDQKPKDARRIWKMYGTLARKGEATDARPHRFARLVEGEPWNEVVAGSNNAALVRLLAAWRLQDEVRGKRRAEAPDAYTNACRYLRTCEPAVMGNDGSKRLMWAARVAVYGFDLGVDRGMQAVKEVYDPICSPPWSDKEILHKCQDADTKPFRDSRGWLLREEVHRNGTTHTATVNSKNPGKKTPPSLWRVTFDDEVLAEGEPSQVLDGVTIETVQQVRHFEMRTIGSLRNKHFPEPNWIVPGIMSEGLNILAGAPKMGKSILALNIALTVAGGGLALGNIPVQPANVLYISLEDKQRRVKARAAKMMQSQAIDRKFHDNIDRNLTIVTDWPRQDQGGLEMAEIWCRRVEHPGLIIIDVWNRFAPRQDSRRSNYSQDSDDLGAVKTFSDKRSLASFVVHHTRKPGAGKEDRDYVIEVSGTSGITGAADGIMVLLRARQEDQARFHVVGRDVEEREFVLEFDADTLTWKSVGTAAEHLRGEVQQAIIRFLRTRGEVGASCPEIADGIHQKQDSVRQALNRMLTERIIRKRGNIWRWPFDEEEATGAGDTFAV